MRIDPSEAIPFVGEGMSGALMQELIEVTERESAARAAAARAMFEAIRQTAGCRASTAPATAGPSASWLEQSGREEEIVVRRGRLADLTVVGRPGADGEPTAHLTFSMALFDTGHPVLVAGSAPQRPGEPVGQRIVIAWNGSVEAARAVSAALPFLARARRVTALSVGSEDEDGGLDAVRRLPRLAWHCGRVGRLVQSRSHDRRRAARCGGGCRPDGDGRLLAQPPARVDLGRGDAPHAGESALPLLVAH